MHSTYAFNVWFGYQPTPPTPKVEEEESSDEEAVHAAKENMKVPGRAASRRNPARADHVNAWLLTF